MQTNFTCLVLGDKQRQELQTSSPVSWASQALKFIADPQQAEVLNSTYRRVLVNCCRQWGKSTTAAVRALHHALHNPAAEIILIAPGLRQSAELLRKITNLSPQPIAKSDGTNRHSLQFANGARILALPANRDKIRGFSKVSLLIIDEAAWVPSSLYFAVRPFLAASPDASLLVMSTPNGDSGFFYQTWANNQTQPGNQPWHRITVKATDCPRISPEFLAEEQATLSDNFFRQEYMCEFLSHNRAVFSGELIEDWFKLNTHAAAKPVHFEL
jgi:hypothetical protein